ncbi:hypothetical protein AB0B69_21545 [Micromonospora parva]|uniref:hypothetical protein n=1 Tax=Micromonospora parva TaxID=1464048 RepID=UPI0033CDD9DD
MPDQFFADIYRDTEHLTWAPTEQVRERGRRRTRQTRIAATLAGVVAVAVVATGAVALAGGQEEAPTPVLPATGSPTPTPTPSATSAPPPPTTSTTPAAPPSTPSRTSDRPSAGTTDPAVPAAAMLRLSDLPTGFTMTEGDVDGDWSVESVSIYCRELPSRTSHGRIAQRTVSYDSPTTGMVQRVVRYSGGNAARDVDRIRAMFTGCVTGSTSSLSVLVDGLGAGDESLLVGSDIEGVPSRWLVVRQGDLVAQLTMDMNSGPEDARQYARRVAQRLCAGTDTC